jgi:hypothetical protein
MAKELAIAFLTLFIGAHLVDPLGDAFDRPLSLFRDVDPAWIGYAMFALLVALSAELARTAWRTGNRNQAAVYLGGVGTLSLIALTPSFSTLHTLATLVTLLGMFANYAWLLDQYDLPYWLTAHLSIVLLLALANFLFPDGFWQKSLDLYLLAAALVHEQAMRKSLARPGPAPVDAPTTKSQPAATVS